MAGWLTGGGRIKKKTAAERLELMRINGHRGRKRWVDPVAYKSYQKMAQAARIDLNGLDHGVLGVSSGWRSLSSQQAAWQRALKKYGTAKEAGKWQARPGGSAHGTGRAFDFHLGFANDSRNVNKIRRTDAWKWMDKHADLFGFYPYKREPWHWEFNPPVIGTRVPIRYDGDDRPFPNPINWNRRVATTSMSTLQLAAQGLYGGVWQEDNDFETPTVMSPFRFQNRSRPISPIFKPNTPSVFTSPIDWH